MATHRDILISIGPDGEVQIQVEGVAGKDCVDLTRSLEEELGDVTDRQFTREYYQETEEQEEEIQVGGSET